MERKKTEFTVGAKVTSNERKDEVKVTGRRSGTKGKKKTEGRRYA